MRRPRERDIDDEIRGHLALSIKERIDRGEDPEAARYGVFGIDGSGRIRRFLGRGAPATGLRELMFASVQVLAPELVAAMPEGPFSSMHDLYPRLFEADGALFGFPYAGTWHVVDTAADLAATEQSLRMRGLPQFMCEDASR